MNKVYLIKPKIGTCFIGCLMVAAISTREANEIKEKYQKEHGSYLELNEVSEEDSLNKVYSFNSGILYDGIMYYD